jgi:hypothetical protein
MTPLDLAGQRFGRLVALSPAGARFRKRLWLCKCDCGAEKPVVGSQLTSGKSQSCGCLQRELISRRKTTHGATRKLVPRWPEYALWRAMINRCYRPQMQSYERYGARGITVCDRWRFGEDGKNGFECFIADAGRRPSPELQIDRVDNDGNYEPGNIRWATATEQANNRRPRKDRRIK